jgi:glycosyltransferase involved in cell wall biosynthesis
MKILIPCSGYGRIIRGIEVWVKNISRVLASKGFDVYIICGQNTLLKGGTKVTLLKFPIVKRESLIYKRRPFEEISSLIESASLSISSFPFLAAFDFDAAILTQWSDLYSFSILRKLKNFKSVFCFQSKPGKLTKNLYMPLTWGVSDKIVSISEFVKAGVKKNIGLDSEVVYNGVDTRLFYPSTIYKRDRITFLYVGLLLKKKGIYTLLNAMKNLDASRFNLVIVGDGPEENNIRKMIESEKLTNVKVLGRVPHEKTPKLYKDSDIVIIPSEYPEAFAIVAADAMSCGRPIIASNIGGLGEIVKKGNSGLLFEPKNEEDLVKKMLILAEDVGERRRLGENGRKFAEKELDWSKVGEKYIRLIKIL